MKQKIKNFTTKLYKFIKSFPFLKRKDPIRPEYVLPETWTTEGEQIAVQTVESNPPQTLKIGKLSIPFIKPIRVIKVEWNIPHLPKIKRIISGILLVISMLMAIASLSISPFVLMIFIFNSIIHLDYLLKTKQSNKKLWPEVKGLKNEK